MRALLSAVLVVFSVAGCAADGNEATEVTGVEVLGPPEANSGGGPHFEWAAVEGASEYGVVVRNADGDTVWAWRGSDTGVWFGGLTRERPAGMSGPVVTTGSTWRVAAFDADGHFVAISKERGLDPG